MHFCHKINEYEACCTSSLGNDTCAELPASVMDNPSLIGNVPNEIDAVIGVVDHDKDGPVVECEDKCCGCGLHGTCDNAVGECKCARGYTGKHCDMPSCNTASDLPCSGHGACDMSTNTCKCAPGYLGLACGTKFPMECSGVLNCTVDTCDCQQAECMNGCNNNGKCGDDFRCQCYKDYSGLDCSYYVGCPNDCSGHGTCSKGVNPAGTFYRGKTYHGQCTCDDMYSMLDCNHVDNNKIGAMMS